MTAPELTEEQRLKVEAFGIHDADAGMDEQSPNTEATVADLVRTIRARCDAVETASPWSGAFDGIIAEFEQTGFSRVKVARRAADLLAALKGAEVGLRAALEIQAFVDEIAKSLSLIEDGQVERKDSQS